MKLCSMVFHMTDLVISYRLGLTAQERRVMKSITYVGNQPIRTVFLEHSLALPGSANVF